MNRWEAVLNDFFSITVPLKAQTDGHSAKYLSYSALKKELDHGWQTEALYSFMDYYLEIPDDKNTESEEEFSLENLSIHQKEGMYLKIQQMLSSYYYSIWSHCTGRERLLLYDASEDGYINFTDKETIYNLLSKGLFVWGRRGPEIMNESFGNFILSMASRDEALNEEIKASSKGRWSNYRSVATLFIGGIVLFLFFAQEQMFEKVIAILTAIVTIVPTLIGSAKGIFFKGT